VDFSGAQRNGFILAFVEFWLEHAPGERAIHELLATAPRRKVRSKEGSCDCTGRSLKVYSKIRPDIFLPSFSPRVQLPGLSRHSFFRVGLKLFGNNNAR
jgi:hypothetical protein